MSNRTRGTRLSVRALAVAGLAALPLAAHASSYEPQGLNLGTSSFNDAFGSTEPGFTYIPSIQVNDYNRINDTNGNANPLFQDPQLTAVTWLNQLIYTTPFKIGGAALGGTILVPFVSLSASTAATSPVALQADGGFKLADISWGPFLQFPPIFYGHRPLFVQRIEFDVNSPTGAYDTSKNVTPGAGNWSINPYYAFTLYPTANTETSWRLHYLHNFENTNPAGQAPYVQNYQAGDAFWANFTLSYKPLPNMNVGLNGYYFKQFTDDHVNGVIVKGTESENLSMGPGAQWAISHQNIVMANLYLPVVEKNDASGVRFVLRWIHAF